MIELGKKLGTTGIGADGTTKFFMPAPVYWLPVPGWVRSQGFAVDYQGRMLVDLEGGWRAISPAGTTTAKVDQKGYVTVEPVALPAQR